MSSIDTSKLLVLESEKDLIEAKEIRDYISNEFKKIKKYNKLVQKRIEELQLKYFLTE